MTTQIDVTQFNETEVIKSLKSKQVEAKLEQSESNVDELIKEVNSKVTTEPPTKSNRGRKRKYTTDEERIIARRQQQKQYRERKKKELLELRALKAQFDSTNANDTM